MSGQAKKQAVDDHHGIKQVDCPVVCLPDHLGRLDPHWLEHLKTQISGSNLYTLPRLSKQHGLIALDGLVTPNQGALKQLTALFDSPFLIITSGLALPAYLGERLALLANEKPQIDVLAFLGNFSEAMDPLCGLSEPLNAQGIDSLVWNLSDATTYPLPRNLFSDIQVALVNPSGQRMPGSDDQIRVGFTEGLYFHTANAPMPQAGLPKQGVHTLLGSLRQKISALVGLGYDHLPYIGLDGLPVTLHISHSWGGGIERWINDLHKHDTKAHHLVLRACSAPDQGEHGQWLELLADGPKQARIHRHDLSEPISDTDADHADYDRFLKWVLRRFGVGRLIVSSLIGHSLDCLRQDCPTLQILHDFYPGSPVLDADPLLYCDPDQGLDLAQLIRDNKKHFAFSNQNPAHWGHLRSQWHQCIGEHNITLIAPSKHVAERWRTLYDNDLPKIECTPHGFDCPAQWSAINPTLPTPGDTLHLIVVGRLSSGKGMARLQKLALHFRNELKLSVIGAGHNGLSLFGLGNVDVILDYDEKTLPEIIHQTKAHAALFLSRVPETWNYVLSELRCLGLPVIAPRQGSFEERITHGVDGLLYPPSTEDLIACIGALIQDPKALVSGALEVEEPTMAQAINAYNRIGEAEPKRPKWIAPPNPSRMGFNRHASALLALEHNQIKSHIENQRLHDEVKEQAQWLERLDRTVKARSRWALELEKDLNERLLISANEREQIAIEYGELQQQHGELQQQHGELQQQHEALEKNYKRLDQELIEILQSRSWRLTRPLRAFVRILTALNHRKAWHPANWIRQTKRLIHAIRIHGWRTTFDALQYHRPAHTLNREAIKPVDHPKDDDTLTPVTITTQESTPGSITASVIIPVYNNAHYTAHCLRSLAEHVPEISYEVIVVNDCSSDETKAFLAQCTGITVINNPTNRGFIGSCNEGASVAQGDYLVFLNNDTEVTHGWLDALLATFRQRDDVGVAGGRLVYPDGQLQEAGGIVFKDGSGWNYGRLGPASASNVTFICETDYVSGACLAIPKALFMSIGGFDDYYTPAYYEDTDLCFKVRARGKKVLYQPRSKVIHFEGVTSGTSESSGTKRYQAINREKFQTRWAETLATHPEPVPGPQAIELIERARHHRTKGHILVIDAVTPRPDHDSGSLRMMGILEILIQMGYRVSFMPINLAWDGHYSEALQELGVEVITHPEIHSPRQWLQLRGPMIDWVIGSRYYVLDDVIADVKALCPNAKVIFDTVDLHFLREQRKAEMEQDASMERTAKQTQDKELALIEKSDITLVVSAIEDGILKKLLPTANIRVLSNIHTPITDIPSYQERHGIFFVGGFQHPPNIDAAKWLIEEILPALQAVSPDIELHLIGSQMPEWLRNKRIPGLRNHGFVDDIEPYLRQCRVALAPLRYGAGVKGKVNQAMAWGVPVVATGCAAEGMYTKHNHDILIAEDTEQFVNEIVRVYQDPQLWNALSRHGRENVDQFFSRRAAKQVLSELLSNPPS